MWHASARSFLSKHFLQKKVLSSTPPPLPDTRATRVDVVLAGKIDRLSRILADHVVIRAQLRERAVSLASVTESLEDSVSANWSSTSPRPWRSSTLPTCQKRSRRGCARRSCKAGWPHRLPRGYRCPAPGTVVIDDVGGEHRRWNYYRCRGSFKSFEAAALGTARSGWSTSTWSNSCRP
jgi:hypothetical protein